MKKIITIILLLIFMQTCLFAQGKKTLTNQSIISLVEQKVETNVINATISISEVDFIFSAEALQNLKDKNVPSEVIVAMLNSQSRTQAKTESKTKSKNLTNTSKFVDLKYSPKVILSLVGGVTFSKLKMSGRGADNITYAYDIKSTVGYSIGALVKMRISKKPLYLSSGYIFVKKGTILAAKSYYSDIKLNLHYMQIPLKLSYMIHLKNNIALIPSFGLYVDYGIVAKEKTDKGSSDNLFLSTDSKVNSRDIGTSFGLGIAFNHFRINATYELGLTDVIGGNTDSRNRSFVLTAEFNILSKGKK